MGFLTPSKAGRSLISPTDSSILHYQIEEGAHTQGERCWVKPLHITKQNHNSDWFTAQFFLVYSECQLDLGLEGQQLGPASVAVPLALPWHGGINN